MDDPPVSSMPLPLFAGAVALSVRMLAPQFDTITRATARAVSG